MLLVKDTIDTKAVNWDDFGLVTAVKDGVVSVSGLYGAMAGELILVNDAVEGVVLNVEDSTIKAIIFDTDDSVEEGF